MKPKQIAASVLIGVAILDLVGGDTNKPLLPAFLANQLTQQYDAILIGIGIFLFVT